MMEGMIDGGLCMCVCARCVDLHTHVVLHVLILFYIHIHSGAYAAGHGGVGAIKVLPIFVFSYTCHQNFPLLLNELAAPTDGRVRVTIGSAAGLSLGTYLLVAQAAYWTYGSATAQVCGCCMFVWG